MKIQKLRSSKLFYNKWPYKVECRIRGASRLTQYNENQLQEYCNSGDDDVRFRYWRHLTSFEKTELMLFYKSANCFIKTEGYGVRAENSHFNVFCKDEASLKEINKRLKQWIIRICGPTTPEEYNFLMSNGHRKILCDELPHKKYKYKLYLKSSGWTEDKRKDMLTWILKYKDAIMPTSSTKDWLAGNSRYVQAPYMYVLDDKMLSMVGLFASGHVKKVEEFIPRELVLEA